MFDNVSVFRYILGVDRTFDERGDRTVYCNVLEGVMGFLYSFGRIRAGRIPCREDFDRMRAVVMEAMQQHSDVVAASVYGSVLRGDHSSRSDLDLVVVCRNDSLDHIQALVDKLSDDAAAQHIFLSVHLHRVSDARAGRHPFGPSCRSTMWQIAYDGNAKGHPHQWFLTPNVDMRMEMEQKLQWKTSQLRRQSNAFFSRVEIDISSESVETWLEKSFRQGDRPFHFYMGFARWMLWWKHRQLKDDSKAGVVAKFLAEAEFSEFHEDFKTLLRLDREYDILLNGVLARRVGARRYFTLVVKMVADVFTIAKRLLSRARVHMRRSAKEPSPLLVA